MKDFINFLLNFRASITTATYFWIFGGLLVLMILGSLMPRFISGNAGINARKIIHGIAIFSIVLLLSFDILAAISKGDYEKMYTTILYVVILVVAKGIDKWFGSYDKMIDKLAAKDWPFMK